MLTGLLGYSVTLPSSKFPLFPLGIQNQPLLSLGHCCHEHLPVSHTVPTWGLGSSGRRGHRAGKSRPCPGPVGSLALVPEAYALAEDLLFGDWSGDVCQRLGFSSGTPS